MTEQQEEEQESRILRVWMWGLTWSCDDLKGTVDPECLVLKCAPG